ncbi:hypothetical protein R1sor_004926 [Riccia sorocarpa]|uniref:BAG domain-containing protein n=1 Tax=Riccia sorocarpa TaxID=122646 RepID=A0ABD3HI25_9MARC
MKEDVPHQYCCFSRSETAWSYGNRVRSGREKRIPRWWEIMNSCSKRSLSPWSVEQEDAASELSGSLDGSCIMPYLRLRENGTYEKNTVLKKIYKDMGFLKVAYKKIYPLTYTKSSFPRHSRRTKADNIPKKHEPYKPKGTPRYSRIDNFIEGLDQACTALPKPLMGDFGHVRPHAVPLQSQPKREVRRIPVHASEFDSTRIRVAEQREVDSEHPQCPLESGAPLSEQEVVQTDKCMSHETGTWKIADEGSRGHERQVGFQGSMVESPFERKKKELVRAATMSPSRYRGRKVRRSQPLKYMHVIGNAKTKLEELKQQFLTWKIVPGFPTDHAETLSLTYNVMNLLKKLDSIKGVPSYIREFRKSVVREVAKFQEEVEAFIRMNAKHGPLFELMRTGNTRCSDSETCKPDVTGMGKPRLQFFKIEELPSEPNVEFLPKEDLAENPHSAEAEESQTSKPEDDIDSGKLAPENVPECTEETVPCREISVISPELSLENQNDPHLASDLSSEFGKNKTSGDESDKCEAVAARVHDICIPSRDDKSRKVKKKSYGVRFQDEVVKVHYVESPNEDFISSKAVEIKPDNTSQYSPETDIKREVDEAYLQESIAQPDIKQEVDNMYPQEFYLKPEGGEERGEDENLPTTYTGGATTSIYGSEPTTEGYVGHMTEPSFPVNEDSPREQGRRIKSRDLAADANFPATTFGSYRPATMPSKSRFCIEQLQMRANSADGSVQRHRAYDGASNLEEGEAVEEHDGEIKVDPTARRRPVKVPALPLEQRLRVNFAGGELRPALKSPRLWKMSNGIQEPVSHSLQKDIDELRNDDSTESARPPTVESITCCSDCAQPRGHYPFECWKPRSRSTSEEELRPKHSAYSENPGDIQDEYAADGPEDFPRFNHRELRYVADSYTVKLSRARQAAELAAANDEQLFYQRQSCLPPRPPTAVHVQQQIPKVYSHTATSYTPSPPDSICSEAERAYQKNMSHLPYRQSVVPEEEKKLWEINKTGQGSENELVTKLADDNKRLKGLLKDVMHWNKAQASAMVSMTERIEHLEGLDKLP